MHCLQSKHTSSHSLGSFPKQPCIKSYQLIKSIVYSIYHWHSGSLSSNIHICWNSFTTLTFHSPNRSSPTQSPQPDCSNRNSYPFLTLSHALPSGSRNESNEWAFPWTTSNPARTPFFCNASANSSLCCHGTKSSWVPWTKYVGVRYVPFWTWASGLMDAICSALGWGRSV